MKTKASYFLTLTLLLLLAATATIEARRPGHPRHQRPANPEIRAYHQANIQPVLRQQRQKLETQLAPADRTLLATYRTQLKALREQGRALHESMTSNATPSNGARPALTDAQREQRQQLHSQTRAIMLNVAQLAQKYEAPIQQLAKEIAPQKEKWAADLKAIAIKNATPEQQERMAARAGRMQHGGTHRFFKPAKFLLMHPNAPAPAAGRDERGIGSTSFYPNPATATSQLEYDVKKAGPVTVELLDSKGNKLRTLVPATQQEKGSHTQQLDLHDLPAGTYFYKIVTKAGSETKRFVKE